MASLDFFKIVVRSEPKNVLGVYPEFLVGRHKDLMIRGGVFYAVWDEAKGLWSTDESDVQEFVDEELWKVFNEVKEKLDAEESNSTVKPYPMKNFSSGKWKEWQSYCKSSADNYHNLDEKLIFSDSKVKKGDYSSKKLPYSLVDGDISSYEKLIGTLYSPTERQKLEWAVGAVLAGDSKYIQKFIVIYGSPGSGKSTFLNIVEEIFSGYCTSFEANKLSGSNNSFSLEPFANNPLVGIQQDGDLSKIKDNTVLNSIVGHDRMNVNEKFKSIYSMRFLAFLFMGTNKPVQITDAKSGIIRRLIEVRPTENKLPFDEYNRLVEDVHYEIGAIAKHCLDVYLKMGAKYYSGYTATDMIGYTNDFYNFIEDSYFVFSKDGTTTLKAAWEMYKAYVEDASFAYHMSKREFRYELENYFDSFDERSRTPDGHQVINLYSGFKKNKFISKYEPEGKEEPYFINLQAQHSLLDDLCATYPAQYATTEGTPKEKWAKVKTVLSDLDTSKLHFVKVPENHIVIDFDIKGEDGEKDLERNLEEANKWPPTYAELSKSGSGIHLHYIYSGDPTRLSRLYGDNIEIKTFPGNSSLRRKLTRCNDIPVKKLTSGLPEKENKVINFEGVKNEKALRALIKKNLNKEIHPATKPSIDFINHILNEAYESGMHYDIRDLRPQIMAFANNSTHQAAYCVEVVAQMKYCSEDANEPVPFSKDEIVFFDVEVFPNLFVIVYKKAGKAYSKLINPTARDVEELLQFKLIGFNNRRYDNHILYARLIGYNNAQLYEESQRIISRSPNAMFGEAYNLSYTDIYDFASAGHKQSLKKFEIELGIHHQELGLPWDQPVPEDMWETVADYCVNDVEATEATFNYLSGDWTARQIIARLSGLTVNDTTNSHAARIIFGKDKHPQDQFVYTDLSEMFPGYKFDAGKSTYRGEETGEGGYVYSEPGMYDNIALLDIASMHPTSIEQLNLFGPYTKKFSEIKLARILIKHKDYEKAKTILNGLLTPFIEELENGTATFTNKDLAAALKTVINSVYGLTSAKFDNIFKDPRNVDNIVAKRGALFMINLKHEVQDRGFTVAHIKTDSIKIPNATPEIISFVQEYGKKYGYIFEHEATYSKMCLVNDAVYVAKESMGEDEGKWVATGTQFAVPYVFKTLFSHEPIVFKDMCETKSVSNGADIFIDMGTEDAHDYHFVGAVGQFTPIKEGHGGGTLYRGKDEKYSSLSGTKGYFWLESEMVNKLKKEDDINTDYYRVLVDKAVNNISQYGDFEQFISE